MSPHNKTDSRTEKYRYNYIDNLAKKWVFLLFLKLCPTKIYRQRNILRSTVLA